MARRTGTATALGARFDGEVDAFLILALSVYAAPIYGAWVLAIGAARYLFLAGEWLLPWMRAPIPPRRWRRVVAAMQGVVLTVAAAEVLPRGATQVAAGRGARRCSRSSMGECVWWLRRAASGARCARGSAWPSRSLALLLVWAALVAPHQPGRFGAGAFARLPVELLAVVALAVAAAGRAAPRAGRRRRRPC